MPSPVDITGKRFGRLVARWVAGSSDAGREWMCECDCGNGVVVRLGSLRQGLTRSCGCYDREVKGRLLRERSTTHGLSGTAEYKVWRGILRRCLNTHEKSYPRYGGRGITVCDRWRTSFENFLADMGPRPSAEHSIERENNDGPYSPENCRWATRLEQAANKRTKSDARYLTAFGRTQTLAQWSRETGIGPRTIAQRLDRHWLPGCALTKGRKTPLRFRLSKALT
jgi:hypothetical protein